jgi:hypothetical protein
MVKLAPFNVSVGNAIGFYVETMQKRQASVSIEALKTEFLENRRAKGKSEIYLTDLEKRHLIWIIQGCEGGAERESSVTPFHRTDPERTSQATHRRFPSWPIKTCSQIRAGKAFAL